MAGLNAATVQARDAGWRLFAGALPIVALALAAATPFTLGLWDEVYYISWIADPGAYSALVHPFCLLFHPIYLALGRSLIALRLVGIILLLTSGGIMGREVARYYRAAAPDVSLTHLPLVGALAGLLYYVLWTLTPSYNLLANVGGALVLAGGFGWLATDRRGTGIDGLASLWCGLGGALAFLGKPTFAALAGTLVAVQLLLAARRDWRVGAARATIAGTTALLPVLASILSVMSFGTFLTRIQAGVGAFGADYSTVMLVKQAIRSVIAGPAYLLVTVVLLVATIVLAATRRVVDGSPTQRPLVALNAGLVLLDAAMLALIARRGLVNAINPWSIPAGSVVISLMLATLALGLALRPALARAPAQLLPLLLLAATPYLISFGTANDLLGQTGTSLFPVLVGGVLCARLCFAPALVRWSELGWVGVVLLLLGWSAIRPYNVPAPVFAATEPIRAPASRSTLYVDAATATYARDLRRLARTAHITPDTPVLDLSGVAPGTVALLGARAPFFPWIIHFSRQPGTLAAAAWRSMSPAEQARTWIVGPINSRFAGEPAIAAIARSGRYRKMATLRYAPAAGAPPVVFWAPVER